MTTMPRGPSIHRVHPIAKRLMGRDNPHLATLRKRVKSASTEPGIYRWLDDNGKVLYVGKAKNLRKRLQWYVSPRPGAFVGPWRQSFLEQIADVDVTVTNTELEALILETNLIKQMKPKYNVLMKDDKNYLYIRVTMHEPFPRVEAARKIIEDGSKYFGPTTSGYEVQRTLALLRRVYPFRTCRMNIEIARPLPLTDERNKQVVSGQLSEDSTVHCPLSTDNSPEKGKIPIDVVCTHKDRTTPCLDFHIEQCSAPCVGTRTPEAYFKESIEGVLTFLKGDREPVKALLTERMRQAAADRKFEQAAQYRDHLDSLERMQEKQLVSDTSGENSDIVGVAVLSQRAHVVTLQRRNGRLIGESHYALAGQAEDEAQVLDEFLPQYYDDGIDLPETLILSADFPGRKLLAEWLRSKKGAVVKITVPERGKKSELLKLAEKNALEKARQHEIRWESEAKNTEQAMEGLRTILELPLVPHRIEGYDISHLGGTETVGSMVVMKDGKASNDHYRSFTIRTMKEGVVDDYRALKEVLKRRLRHFCEDLPAEERKWKDGGVSFGKARKAEQAEIERIHGLHREEMGDMNIAYRDYLVARHEEEIIGFGRLVKHGGGLVELKSIWVDDRWRGQKLGQFIARKILRGVKKGKVYVTIDPSLEQYYGGLGFRYVIKPPKLLEEKIAEGVKNHPNPESLRVLVMMWEASQNKIDPSLSSKPDLIVVDGGKGQLSAAMEIIRACNLDIPTIGLAKREEEVFVPAFAVNKHDESEPHTEIGLQEAAAGRPDRFRLVEFPKDSQAKFLLMRLRDEAHRFANRHREKRGKTKAIRSALDDIPGIGGETKKKLLAKFGTVNGIRTASDKELKEVLNQAQVEALRKIL